MTVADHAWRLRPWRDADAAEIEALLDLVYAGDPITRETQAVHGPDRDDPGAFSRTVVGERDEGIVAAGTVWESAFAPARWRVSLQVHPNHRQLGVGSALLSGLGAIAAARGDHPLQAGLRADASESERFLIRRGFRHLMRTRLGTIDPAVISSATWDTLGAAAWLAAQAGHRIEVLADLMDRAAVVPKIASLHAAIYRQTHAWSPPAPINESQAEANFLGDDLIPDALFVAFAAEGPIGVASLRRGSAPGDIDLGWTGVVAAHAAFAPDVTAALLDRCLRYAREMSWVVRIEVDEADRVLWTLLDALPVSLEADWLNLERISIAATVL